MPKNGYFTTVALIFGLVVAVAQDQLAAAPINHLAAIAPFVNDDTFAVAYIDVGSLNAANLGELFAMLPKPADQVQAEMLGFAVVSSWVKSFQARGGRDYTGCWD